MSAERHQSGLRVTAVTPLCKDLSATEACGGAKRGIDEPGTELDAWNRHIMTGMLGVPRKERDGEHTGLGGRGGRKQCKIKPLGIQSPAYESTRRLP